MNTEKIQESKRRYEEKRRQINFSVSIKEFDRIRIRAKTDGFTRVVTRRTEEGRARKDKVPAPALLAKVAVMHYVDNIEPVPESQLEELRALTVEIRRIGNNLNQAIKAAHINAKEKGPEANLAFYQHLNRALYEAMNFENILNDFKKKRMK